MGRDHGVCSIAGNCFCQTSCSKFALALRGLLPYYAPLMRLNALLIVSLLVTVIAAPIVDGIACDDCRDIIPPRAMQQGLANGAGTSNDSPSSDAGSTAPQETGTAQDLCPVCANTAVAIDNGCCCAPSMISQTNHLPKLIALSDPSYSINKPPQI